jgi:hypothetical protein
VAKNGRRPACQRDQSIFNRLVWTLQELVFRVWGITGPRDRGAGCWWNNRRSSTKTFWYCRCFYQWCLCAQPREGWAHVRPLDSWTPWANARQRVDFMMAWLPWEHRYLQKPLVKEGWGGRVDPHVRGDGASIARARARTEHGGKNARGNQTASGTIVE